MPYAERQLVLSRAGRLSAAWDENTHPGYPDIDVHLATVAAELDASFAARGIATPYSAVVQAALEGVNADGALVLMIEGSWPGGKGNEETSAIYNAAKARYMGARTAISAGTFEAIVVAVGQAGGGGEDADNFWSAEPNYGRINVLERIELNPWLQPTAGRGMRF